MNMLLHGIKFSNFKIENGDTLEWDAFGDTQFDAVVANPPFSAEWSAADKFNNDDRFSKAGRLAPKKTADYAFILHMIYHLNEGGTMACVAPHGVLFRGNAEGIIRRFLIEKKNYIDAIMVQVFRPAFLSSKNVAKRTIISCSLTQAKNLKK